MKITYIHHSCFLAETESACLLFDYFEGELPPIPENKPLYILASHNHHDHFSEAVFSFDHRLQYPAQLGQIPGEGNVDITGALPGHDLRHRRLNGAERCFHVGAVPLVAHHRHEG